jgi:hypothetical protein
MRTKIKIIYKTEGGVELSTLEEAIVGTVLENIKSCYIPSHQIKSIAKGICEKLSITELPEVREEEVNEVI